MKLPTWILMDIEGTTTSISFVHDVLFPYARTRMSTFLSTHSENKEVAIEVDALRSRLGLSSLTDVVSTLDRWMGEDRKETELKSLQGLLWRDGYMSGDFTGHVYPDVSDALSRWKDAGIQLAVYSSGSVAAQKLLFQYSDAGNLDALFDANFDTRVGHKREKASYLEIARQLGSPATEIVFLSDIGEELHAASEAGMSSVQLMRSGNVRDDRFDYCETFEELDQMWSKPV